MSRVQRHRTDQLAQHIIVRVATFLRKLQLQSCRVHALRDSEHNRAEDWPHLAEFRTRQQQHQALCSGSPKSSFGSTLNLENLECLQKKTCSNILLLLEPCLGPILEICMGRRARNHPGARRRAAATGAPDGAELLGWGRRRRQPGKRGGRAGCTHTTELEHRQLWKAEELGSRARSPCRCTTGCRQEANTAPRPPTEDRQQRPVLGCRSPTAGVKRGRLLIAHGHTRQQFGSVIEEVYSFQAETAGRSLSKQMVNCSGWN